MRRVWESLFGVLIVGAAIYIALQTDRGDVLIMALTAFGAFFVSKSLVQDALKQGLQFFRGDR